MPHRAVLFTPLLATLALIGHTGCSGIGPGTVVPSRFDYTAAIGDSWKQQMLINLVKVRYGDCLVFLDVSSVVSQYQLATAVNWGGAFNNYSTSANPQLNLSAATPNTLGGALNWGENVTNPILSNTQTVGVTGAYADRPTITYAPLSGEKFTRMLMKPIPPPALLSLIQSGYPIDFVLQGCVHTINGVRNRFGGVARAHPADPQFYPLLQRLRKIQDSGQMDMRIQKTKDLEAVLMTVRSKNDQAVEEDIHFVRKTLGLDPKAHEFSVTFGSIAQNDHEIAILTRSVREIISDMASDIEVPTAHVEEKRTSPTRAENDQDGAPLVPLISIHSSRRWPGDAFVAVPYRNHWYWIDDRDMRSKMVFSFLLLVFSLTDTTGTEGAPILTIPTG